MKATATHVLTQADLDGFAKVSGDDNPIHVDVRYAATTPFQVPVAHGMFLFSWVRALLREHWPDARLREQQLMFPNPTAVGATVTVHVEVIADDGAQVRVATTVTTDSGLVGLQGEAVLWRVGGER